MKRLITFGCSLTYGQFLENREEECWPKKLANKLGVELINVSEPGASNKQIHYNILNFDFDNDDVCVILWTNPHRWILYKQDGPEKIGAWQSDARALSFVEHFWDDHDMILDLHERAYHANLHIPVKTYHTASCNDWLQYPPKWSNVEWLDIDFNNKRQEMPKATDGSHPGYEFHEWFADELHWRMT